LILAAALSLLAPAVATAEGSKSTTKSAAGESSEMPAAKKVKVKRKPAPKVEYMRAVPSR
jgi:hypothetical protein